MTALAPGLYRATVRGVPDTTILVSDEGCGWTALPVDDCRLHHFPRDITDARPLIVLDLTEGDARQVMKTLRRAGYTEPAMQIEWQTKPPRIPEPGLWGVVEASPAKGVSRFRWVRVNTGDVSWQTSGWGHRKWAELIDPTLIRDGVTS